MNASASAITPVAAAHAPARSTSSAGQILTFARGNYSFAADVSGIREIRRFDRIRPVVLGIPTLAGFVCLRDQVLPVFEPLAFLDQRPPDQTAPLTACVCGNYEVAQFCLMVDRIEAHVRLDAGWHEPAPAGSSEFIIGRRQFSPGQSSLVIDLERIRQLLQAPLLPRRTTDLSP